MGLSLQTCGVCAYSGQPASEQNGNVGHPVGAQKVGFRTAVVDLEKSIHRGRVSAQQTLCFRPVIFLTRSSIPSSGWVLHTVPWLAYKELHLWYNLICFSQHPHFVCLPLFRRGHRLKDVEGQTAYISYTKFWVFSRLSFKQAAHIGCRGVGLSVLGGQEDNKECIV